MYEIKFASEKSLEAFKLIAKERMLNLGWTQQELANKLGRPKSTVKKFFSKGQWNRYLAAEIATALKITQLDIDIKLHGESKVSETDFLNWMRHLGAGMEILSFQQSEEFEQRCLLSVVEEGQERVIVFYRALFQQLRDKK